ncbi:YifB family Mg chelatase-like AAA ATPase [Nitrosophilus kaiyonis]|uniref:YifB family Mg chelatase-like AAA ATPase n=1 Tax=Nitrosophilus kaiyonis TaxID=2930200 RepID=UPI00248F54EF|nr:YifB family Mg chelatase-like AAA ATPase [Nitrosophilus kaiyonis]
MKKLFCATFTDGKAFTVEVESSFVRALPSFSVVGLASNSIQESKDRVKSALNFIDFKFPPLKITINLSPSDLKKSGSHFDLAIALSIALQKENVDFKDYYIFGELGLDGKLKDTNTIFPLILSLRKSVNNLKVVIPKDSAKKVSKIPDIKIYPVDNLQEAIDFFKEENIKEIESSEIDSDYLVKDNKKYYYLNSFEMDILDVKGQEFAKRAALIAATGMHNILFEGSPGCGKSMISKRLRYILPPLSLEEILEIAKNEAMDSKEPQFIPLRPFRAPHHSSTKASIFGGGTNSAKIGEVALANKGILFFDELPHFSKNVLEALREPLEDRKILISRVNNKIEYQTDFMFIGAMNPCPCGNLLSTTKECRCSDVEIQRYKNRLSEPFLDRIDIYVQMSEIKKEDKSTISSSEMYKNILKAFIFQKERKQNEFNGKLNEKEIEKYCILSKDAENILENAIERFSLTFRSINKIKKVSRTIADLDGSEKIEKKHILEALSYRKR